jgi:hypothetical protein
MIRRKDNKGWRRVEGFLQRLYTKEKVQEKKVGETPPP